MSHEYEEIRKEARDEFVAAGLTYDVLTTDTVQSLRNHINDQMKASDCMQGTFRCRQRGIVKETRRGRFAEIRCKAYYFDNREAVTFNTDGFIGFAGWADNTNIKPIVAGFKSWVAEQAAKLQEKP